MTRVNLIFIVLAGILMSLFGEGLADPSQNRSVVEYYDIKLSGELRNGSKFELLLTTKFYSKKIKKPKFLPKEGYWGTDGRDPIRVIEKLKLNFEGKDVFISQETFSDLGDVNVSGGVYLGKASNGLDVYIEGGDGAGSYKAIFHIKKGKLVSRTIKFMDMNGDMDSTEIMFEN